MSPVSDSKIVFTRAEAKDSLEVLHWIREYYAYDHIEFHEDVIESALPELLGSDTHGLAYFIDLEGARVGYFILTFAFDLEFSGRHATVTDLFFKSGNRRSGLGSKTLAFIQSLCRDRKISHLVLQVETDNEEAKVFYQKAKFMTLSRHILVKAIEGKTS